MRIAVASDDKVNLALHFGRASYFILYETEHHRIVNKLLLKNSFTGHTRGHSMHPIHTHQHSHREVINGLAECDIIISHGMGQRLYNDFRDAGKKVFIASAPSAEAAVTQYLEGKLMDDPITCCTGSKYV